MAVNIHILAVSNHILAVNNHSPSDQTPSDFGHLPSDEGGVGSLIVILYISKSRHERCTVKGLTLPLATATCSGWTA